MQQIKKAYGYAYDKKGNLISVNRPIYGNGKPVRKTNVIQTNGKIPNGVGYPGFPQNNFPHIL